MADDTIRKALVGGGLLGVTGVVAYFATGYLVIPLGEDQTVQLTGVAAALAGSAIGIAAKPFFKWWGIVLLAVAALAGFAYALNMYIETATGPAGSEAAFRLILWTCGVFAPLALLTSLAGYKFAIDP